MPASVDLLVEPSMRASPLQLPQPPPPLPSQSPRPPQGEGIPDRGVCTLGTRLPRPRALTQAPRRSPAARMSPGSAQASQRVRGQAASHRGVNGSHGLAAAPPGERTCPQPAGSASQERVRAVSGSGSGGEAEGDGGVTENSSSLRLPSLGLPSKPRPALKDTSGLHP